MDWTVELVEKNTTKLLGKQGPFRPTARFVEVGGAAFVAKDYRACMAFYRWTVGAWNLRREEAALARLAGLDGVPALEARVGRWILVMSHIAGFDIGKTRKRKQTREYFDALARLVEEMHRRGVVHLDLRQRRNVMRRADGRPAVIDFGNALCLPPGSRRLAWFAWIDRSGVLKYKRRADPKLLTDDEAAFLRRIEGRRKFWPFG